MRMNAKYPGPFAYRLVTNILAGMSKPLSPWMRDGVFCFHQGRCGSTILSNLVNQHPKISCYGEIFRRSRDRGTLSQAWAKKNLLQHRTRAFGRFAVAEAKFFDCQDLSLLDLTIDQFIDVLKECGFEKYIVLDRKNYLRIVLSILVAKKRGGVWHSYSSDMPPERATVHLDTNRACTRGKCSPIFELFEYMEDQYKALNAALENESCLHLTYEKDLQDNPLKGYEKVCNWLDVNIAPAHTALRKTTNVELESVIENWQEIQELFSDSKYSWMLD